MVLLPDHSTDEAVAFANRIRQEIKVYPFKVDGTRRQLTVSMGVASWPDHGETLTEVQTAANAAEVLAKKKGRDRVEAAAAASGTATDAVALAQLALREEAFRKARKA